MISHAASLAPGAPITTRRLLEASGIAGVMQLVGGEGGLDRWLTHPRIQKSGLGLAGHMHGIVPSRVQIFGETEISYLESLPPPTRRIRLQGMFALGMSCVVVTRGVSPMPELLEAATETDTPLLVMVPRSSITIAILHDALDELLAPRASVHGVAVEVYGVGMLLEGPSGIGKSECALFLVERGHRLVADDRVELVRLPQRGVRASPPALLRDHLEVRGLGILNIRALFGATAVRDDVQLDLVVELRPTGEGESEDDRLGLDKLTKDVLGAPLPLLRVPVRPGRDMGVLLEVAARNQLLKSAGIDAAHELVRVIDRSRTA
jgi:HPr kinase/phosphorylase